MTQPLVYVSAPATTPYRYGLFSAAAVVDPVDQREFHAGVQWEPACVDAPAPTTAAVVAGEARAPMTLPDGVPAGRAGVIRLYAGMTDRATGRDDLLERARLQLGLVEQQSLEHYAWTGQAGSMPFLADPATPVLAGSDTAAVPVPVPVGVGLLEAFIADRTGVLGVVWAPRWTAGWWASEGLLRVENPRAVAPLGNPVVFAQTSGVGPDGDEPAVGQAWLYATGPVMVRRSAVLLPRLANVLDRRSNEVFAVAQRFYTVGWGCAVAAVKVRFPAWPG